MRLQLEQRKGLAMEHADLIKHLSSETVYTEYELRAFFRVFSKIVRESLASGQDVQINGIGKIQNKLGKARKGRNPKTGESVDIPPKRRLKFKTCTELEMMMRAAGNKIHEDPDRFLKGKDNGEIRSSNRPRERKNGSARKTLPKVWLSSYR